MSLSVLISIYYKENPKYFQKSLESIYDNQIVKPNEIILVKDGELTLELDNIISIWRNKLGTILKVIVLENNVGLAKALNTGLDYCTCDYIARMDTDDISMPERFKKQINILSNSNIDMCGTNAILINNDGNVVGNKKILNKVTFYSLLKRCEIIHPSTMFKSDFFTKFGRYNDSFKKSQDYELWLRASKQGAKIINLNESLIKFRISDDLIIRRKDGQKYNLIIKKKYINGLKYYISIIPNILILILPIFILDILFKIKNRR
jgi:glycosyltransferase involved in cell wall biosynthesis